MEQTNEASLLSRLSRQNALIKESREKIQALSARINQPVAIVGMGCRVPGADNVDALWELLKNGREAVSRVPLERWDIDAYYAQEPGTPFKTYARRAGYLSDVDLFDARFFGISPREAQQMDPQQRLLLEVSYQALEHAKVPADSLRGEAVGVFIGISSSEYGAMTFAEDRLVSQDAYSITGTSLNSAAGRLAYYYGFHGPALAIDTACSSSLVAIYQACRSLINLECYTALAGGVNTLLTPGPSIALAQNKVLSASGRCSPFSSEADGLVRGEGCGVLVLKRLDDALAENGQILAVIRAGHVNQDGASSGLTVPNGYAQQSLITQAVRNARLKPDDIRYVEAHGTGTVLGDPIEAKALQQALCEGQDRQSPLLIGSVKANIGHLEAASGVAGVMKVVLAMQHRHLPAQIHIKERTSLIDWQNDMDVVREAVPVTYGPDAPYFAGVSSFGFSGTNAHLIIQDPCSAGAVPKSMAAEVKPAAPVAQFLGVSAKDSTALRSLLQRYREHFTQEKEWKQACEALNAGRSHYAYRAGFVARDHADLITQLETACQTPRSSELPAAPLVAWLFTGQGSQYVQMGRMLFDTQPAFRQWLEQGDQAVAKYLGRSILPVMWQEAATLNNTQYTQPAIFCLQYALAQFMSSLTGQPQFVLGHSIGEYAAAVVAGVFDLDDAARMIVARGRLMVERCAQGRMLVVFADHQQVDALLLDSGEGTEVAVAVVNGPNNHVLSGTPDAIERLAQLAQASELRCVPLTVSHAFHSPMMTPMLSEFEQIVKQTRFTRPRIGFISTALGRSADGELVDPAYWVSQVRNAVLFDQAVAALAADGVWAAAPARVCVELGPDKQLVNMARALPVASAAYWLNVLQMRDDLTAFAETVRCLYQFGLPLHWPRRTSTGTALLPLPGYPFSRQRFWLAGACRSSASNRALDYEVEWREVPQSALTGTLQGHWLLLIDDDELADALLKVMIQAGAKVQVFAPATFNPNRLFDTLALTEIEAVIFYAPDISGRPESASSFNALNVITRIFPEADGSMPRLFCVVDSCSAGYRPLASSIAGLCRTVREEESLAITLIGLDDSLQAALRATALVDEISKDRGNEWERRINGAQVLAPRLRVLPMGETGAEQNAVKNDVIRGDRSYLITGGTGMLGRLFAEELLARGVRDLVLIARRANNDALAALQGQAESCGARLSVYTVDLSDGEAMQSFFKQLRQAHAPLAGIIHAAGQLADAPFRQLDTAAFARAFDAKASGAWWLDQLSADMSLDFFVMISSISAVLGAVGQANYASANGYLDGLALQRWEQGKPALSLRLGAIAGGGMAADGRVIRQLQRLGIMPLAPSLLRDRCTQWLNKSTPLAMFASFDWPRISARQGEATRLLLSTVMPSHTAQKTEEPEITAPTTVRCEPEVVEKIVTETIATILEMPDPETIGANDTLNALGMDSVTLVELSGQLQQKLGCDVPTRLLFDFPQVGKLILQLQMVLRAQQGEDVAADSVNSADHSITGERIDIAIVGMGCRFPGGVNSPETFWSALAEGRDLIGRIDTLRWDALSLVQKGELATVRAGVIDDIDYFDCDLFGISPREAQCMDPQQRLLLETGWEALERAGYDFSSNDVLGGVFIGPGPNDYARRFPTDVLSLSHHHSTGNALSVTAGRLAFTLDWQGPALAVDTACSSSLMAVHLAVQSLRRGECDIALAGGVNLLLSAETSVLLSKGSMLAPDGRCKTFDAKANGYVRSEGCGMVVLKRLDDAIACGDNVLAVVRGSATNQDGHSQGLTAPNGQAQQRVLRRALADGAVDPAQVELLEAHGTGTPLGDPIEMAAIQAVYVDAVDSVKRRQSPLWVSSVKTNMGHAEAAAGIAGLIKAVLCLTQKTIAPHLNFSRLNPEIKLDPSTLRIPDTPQPWQGNHPRFAAVSSFGFSGTNVHLILQSAPEQSASPALEKQLAEQPKGLRISAASANRQRFWQDWQESPVRQHRVLTSPPLWLRLSSKQASLVVYAVDYVKQPPFNLQDHLVHGEPVVPAAAHLALIVGMLNDLRGLRSWEIVDVFCEDALVVDADTEVVRYQFRALSVDEGDGFSIEVLSDDDKRTQRHLRARACVAHSQPVSVDIPASARVLSKIDDITFYDSLYSPEIRLSHSFRRIDSIEQYVGYTVSEIAWTVGEHDAIAPGELDSLLQTIALATMADQPRQSHMGGATIPVAIDRITVAPRKNTAGFSQAPAVCKTRLVKQDEDGTTFVHDLALAEQGQEPFISIEGLVTRRVSAQQIRRVAASPYYLTEKWVARPLVHDAPGDMSNDPHALVFVLLNTEENSVDPRWRTWLSEAGTLLDANTCDLNRLLHAIDGRSVCLVYCLPALGRVSGASEEKPWIQQAMALIAAARSACQLSESLSSPRSNIRFRILSEGYADITGESGSPLYGFALGLCKSLNLEWLTCPVGMLDMDAATLQQCPTALAAEGWQLRADWIAWRNGQRYVLRVAELQASSMITETDFHCHDDGLYLLTGGLGDLAMATCQWLAQRGGRHFLLLGRRAEDVNITQQLAQLRDATGAQIDYQPCDVTNRQALAELLAEAQLSRQLRGIFHCAGALADGVFTALNDDDFERVISVKVLGSWYLHELTQDVALDSFVMYSSLASLLGSAGQSNYAAANGFMDQLAHYRHGLGLPALAINWAGWDEIGMAAGRSSNLGLRLLSPARAIADLECVMASKRAQLGVIDVDWPVFTGLWRDSPPALVEDWVAAHRPITETLVPMHRSNTDILQDLRELPAFAKVEAIRQHLRLMARQILKLDDSRTLDDHKSFFELGFDSLMSIELKQKLQEKFHIRVPATLVFDYPHVENLAAFVVQALGLEDAVIETALPEQTSSLDDLDENQLAQMLESLL